MAEIIRLVKLSIAALGGVIAFMLAVVLWVTLVPSTVASVALDDGVVISVRKFLGVTEGHYDITYKAKDGTTGSAFLIGTWISNERFNIYQTDFGAIALIATTGASVFFDPHARKGSEAIMPESVDAAQSKSWAYIGTFALAKSGKLFFSKTTPECISLLGAGSSPFRVDKQAQSRCPEVRGDANSK